MQTERRYFKRINIYIYIISDLENLWTYGTSIWRSKIYSNVYIICYIRVYVVQDALTGWSFRPVFLKLETAAPPREPWVYYLGGIYYVYNIYFVFTILLRPWAFMEKKTNWILVKTTARISIDFKSGFIHINSFCVDIFLRNCIFTTSNNTEQT